MNPNIKKLLIRLIPIIGPFLLQIALFVLIIIVIMAPIVAAKEFVGNAANGVGDFFERFGGLFTGRGWNTYEESYYKLLDGLDCEDRKLVTSTVMYYYQTAPDAEFEGATEDPQPDVEADPDADLPYGEILGDAKRLVKKIKDGDMDEYEEYVKNKFLDSNPYNKLLKDASDKNAEKDRIYNDMISIASSVECDSKSNRFSEVCYGSYDDVGTAEIDIKNLDNVWVKVASSSCETGTLEDCQSWIAEIPFKDYIFGVVAAENNTTNIEALKAQFVATKSYTLARIREMNRVWHEVDGKYVIYMLGSTKDQEYMDVNKINEITRSRFEEAYEATRNDFIVDENNNIALTQYCSDFGICNFCSKGDGTCLAQQTANRTTDKTYREILGYHYSAFKLYDLSEKTLKVSSTTCVGIFGSGQLRHPIDVDKYTITSPFGLRIHPVTKEKKGHTGLDMGANAGTPIYAFAPGKVIKEAKSSSGYGFHIVIGHDIDADGKYDYHSLYGHNSQNLVTVGDEVAGGEMIAKVGSTGMSTGPHLHFEVIKVNANGEIIEYMDPKLILDDIDAGTSIFNDMIKNDRKYYNQGDYQQQYCPGDMSGSNQATIANSGCLPTSVAIIAASMKNPEISPNMVADNICSNYRDYRVSGSGTRSDILTNQSFLSDYGLKSTYINSDYKNKIKDELNQGKMIIVNVKGGIFNPSGAGHYFVLGGISGDNVSVYDPGNRARTKTYPISDVTSNILNGIWIFE
ncbi:MAG: hypothetical protein E7166_05020 [Firmicutes bacterium]|nr:hypothetical protein [Bacillota bacterium]